MRRPADPLSASGSLRDAAPSPLGWSQPVRTPVGSVGLAVVPEAIHLFEEPGTLEAIARLAAHWFQRHWNGSASR